MYPPSNHHGRDKKGTLEAGSCPLPCLLAEGYIHLPVLQLGRAPGA